MGQPRGRIFANASLVREQSARDRQTQAVVACPFGSSCLGKTLQQKCNTAYDFFPLQKCSGVVFRPILQSIDR